mgnify:CR=1 FL=1
MRTILVTGGAGFIGSHLIRHLLGRYPNYRLVNVDALTYAGNLMNLQDMEGNPRYTFERADIADAEAIDAVFARHRPDAVIHLAAESHVDRSILDPGAFVRTNVLGTVALLRVAQSHWANDFVGKVFYHVSTDEVYGSLGAEGRFREDTPYDPHSPYSASKAASDHFVRAWHDTYGLPVLISNCSNNYGPYQFPEKLLPLIILNLREGKPLPVYGTGENVRDWLWVGDHCAAIDAILHGGRVGQTYNIGGDNEWRNIDLVRRVCQLFDELTGRPNGTGEQAITFVTDRPGHDQRYAIDATKLQTELGWRPQTGFDAGLRQTIAWYLENDAWIAAVRSGDYLRYYDEQYSSRLG